MKSAKRLAALVCTAALALAVLSGCGGKQAADNKNITIWTSGEDYRNEYYLTELRKKFPDYNITLEYMNSSSIAAKVMEEGNNCSCDIILSEEYGYLYKCEEYLAELKGFDFSVFLDDIVPENHKFTPESKEGGCIIINPSMLEEHRMPVPGSYQDLLNPQYKGLISMASPLSSGTAYMFLRQLTNEWGEEDAFDYFEKFSRNVLQFTSSGSGPVNALIQGEVAIGLGMTAQAVIEINNGAELEILFFEEGSPFSMYGNAVLAHSADRECVMEVFNYLATDLCRGNNERFFPDPIFVNFAPTIKGYPSNINYGDMSNDTLSEKERLQGKWNFN